MHFVRAIASLSCVVLLCPVFAYGWGGQGHHVVGAIADIRLKGTNAGKRVKDILKQGDPANGVPALKCTQTPALCTLAKYAVWADCAKSPEYCPKEENGHVWSDGEMRVFDQAHKEHHSYHYTDIPVQEKKYFLKSVGATPDDIVQIIRECIELLKSGGQESANHKLSPRHALILLAHLVGDIHQPLHVGALYLDSSEKPINPNNPGTQFEDTHGGNFLMLGSTNLHSYWDSTTVQRVMTLRTKPDARSPEALAAILVKNPPTWQSPGNVEDWPENWANETLQLASVAYGGLQLGSRHTVVDEHTRKPHMQWEINNAADYDKNGARKVAQAQLTKAGYRLAEVLKKIWP